MAVTGRPWGTIVLLNIIGWSLHFWGPDTAQAAMLGIIVFGAALLYLPLRCE